MKDKSLLEVCIALGVTVTFVLMVSGNWHPPASIKLALWISLAILALGLLIFTEIGRAIIALFVGGVTLWAVFTGQAEEWLSRLPEWVGNLFLLAIIGWVVWFAFEATRNRIKLTKKDNPELSGVDLIRHSWRNREQLLRSDEWIKLHQKDKETKQ